MHVLLFASLIALNMPVGEVKHYKDSEMKAVAQKFWVKRSHGLLTVVKNGKTRPIPTIFKTLGVDPGRLDKPRHVRMDFVDYHIWRVSESYELSIMVALNSRSSEGYGVRLKRKDK